MLAQPIQHVSITLFWSFVMAYLFGDEGRTEENEAEKGRQRTTTKAGEALSILTYLYCVLRRGAESLRTSDKAEGTKDIQAAIPFALPDLHLHNIK